MNITKWLLVALLIVSASAVSAENGILSDPMTIGVGARSLGMGRTYVGVAEDGDAVFMNPAGIARSSGPRLTSMYTNLMSDVNYVVLGGSYPLPGRSALGLGYISASTGDIILTTAAGSIEGTDGRWANNVVFASYGTYLNDLPMFSGLQKDVLLGGSLKYYSTNGGGTSSSDITAGNGTGYSADLGVLVPATDFMTLGANYQNILGGKLSKSGGSSDDLAQTLKLGTKITLLGREGASITAHNIRKLYVNADYDLAMNGGRANALHLGTEFWPTGNLALRAGYDQNEVTAGLGLRFSGIEFDYAYHPYAGIGDDATHFFSLSYLGEAQKRQLKVVIEKPDDKTVIREDFVKLVGHVEVIEGDDSDGPAGPVTLKINNVPIPLAADRSFTADLPVEKIGKNMIALEAADAAGDRVAQDYRLVRLITFADVPEGYWARTPIENTGTVGLVEGYPDGTFRPENALTRAELATLLVRAKGLKLPDRQARRMFKDVKPEYWAAKYIEVAQTNGLVVGYPDKSFRPNNRITRVEGITVLARFDNLKLAEVYEKPYWDMSTNHWGARYVQAAKDAGMLKFVERNRLNPKESLSRSESVEMLSKTQLADGEVKFLYDWEKGFRQPEEAKPRIRASLY